MNQSITTWVLAGALAASLAWNAKGWWCSPATLLQQSQPECLAGPDLSRLGLTPTQKQALEVWRRNACEPNSLMDREAEAKLQELHAALSNPAATPASLRALSSEVSRLRTHSLESCVDSILEVRRVLTPQQLAQLMQCCDPTTCSDL